MTVFRSVAILAALGVLAASVSCGSKTATTPTAPTYTTYTDSFADGVLVAGARIDNPDFGPAGAPHKFTVHDGSTTYPSTVTATVQFLSPVSTMVFGLGLTTWNASTNSCNLPMPYVSTSTVLGQAVSAQTSTPGDYCVALYDIGNVVGQSTYTVIVTHN